MTPTTSIWYVVQTHPHAERKACWHLERQGFETYMPCYLKRRRHARRSETVIAPLFPRYLFVAVHMQSQRWRCIQSTIGVARLVRNGDEPAPVIPQVLSEIRAREDAQGYVCIDTRPRFARGDKVRVIEGALAACQGLFECATDGERVAILLDLLGRKVRVTIDAEQVAAA